jgi:hypothetical protein
MSHHQGMILASITNILTDDMFVKLFHSFINMDILDYLLDEDIPLYPEIVDSRSEKFSIEGYD